MSDFGFSWIGLVYLLILYIPNILWARQKPLGYDRIVDHEVTWMVWLERAGEVLVTVFALIFAETNPHEPVNAWTTWLVFSVSCMMLYIAAWRLYFKTPDSQKLEAMYASMLGIPVPLATLPVAGFFLLGLYGHAWPLVAATVILGIGHIGIHINHARELGI